MAGVTQKLLLGLSEDRFIAEQTVKLSKVNFWPVFIAETRAKCCLWKADLSSSSGCSFSDLSFTVNHCKLNFTDALVPEWEQIQRHSGSVQVKEARRVKALTGASMTVLLQSSYTV